MLYNSSESIAHAYASKNELKKRAKGREKDAAKAAKAASAPPAQQKSGTAKSAEEDEGLLSANACSRHQHYEPC